LYTVLSAFDLILHAILVLVVVVEDDDRTTEETLAAG
jgi:hypothetical protein